MPSFITEERYRDAADAYEGWCTNCQDFTRFETEPDAEKYECPVCGEHAVMGAEQGLLCGEFEFCDDE